MWGTGMKRLPKLLAVLLVCAGLYLLFLIGVFLAMCRPPEVFASIVGRTPRPVMAIAPFRHLWLAARCGDLHVGDRAPDFSLAPNDGGSPVWLSSFRGERPAVLIFGSYT